MEKQLLFIAILPGEPIASAITEFKEYAARHFQSGRALRSPPHITLIPPFWWLPAERGLLDETLSDFCQRQSPFDVQLCGFDCFAPRVIFVAVAPNPDLTGLEAGLKHHLYLEAGLPARDKRPFHPHLTVAFKDLRDSVFPSAWEYFSVLPYESTFQAKRLTLLQYRGKRWEIAACFPLGKT